MKKRALQFLLFILFVTTFSCGPRRYGCGPNRKCENLIEKQKNNPVFNKFIKKKTC